jgi:UDP-N-acetylmuramyl pentapeptide phosphotransferase/UDP-N-acetylglucosamine-1-phosphate transferase
MEYVLLILGYFILLLIYFKIANKYNIVDKPNFRSAHVDVTLRGGGVVFWFSALFYFIQNSSNNYFFFIGITILSIISFWDDIQSLPNRIRLAAHFVAFTLVFYDLHLISVYGFLITLVFYFVAIGILNAYNFMDGINGITGLYTLVVLGSFLYVNTYLYYFIDNDFIIYPMLASVVFLFFNFRKKAKCFAGDIGSISIAFWIIYLLAKLIIASNSYLWLLFLAVYGIETSFTILHRLYLKENIFEAHSWHFYQILSNVFKFPHQLTSVIYAFLQLLVGIVVVLLNEKLPQTAIWFIVLIPLIGLYLTKFYLLKNSKKIKTVKT